MNHKKKTYELIVEQITLFCLEENLQPGDRLPSERALASMFGVSRNSIREALKKLESNDLIETRQGGGSFLSTPKRELLGNELRTKIDKTKAVLINEMLEVRRAFEVEAASLAAQRATPENLKMIRKSLTLMAQAKNNPELGVQADVDFHLQIAHATNNHLLIDLMETLATRMEENIRETRNHRFIDTNRHQETLFEHEEIYNAIASNNSELAKQLMDRHISRIQTELGNSI
ncbi:FadR/GntR family transcriptional regulator [Planococcus sp. PAMC 21323]|uniref:FadR/GntR family transcriptional regulator n=1 Tax=Planococcus sp. PAMC 21323 TaxID=1526927 RepID=UPI000570CFD6|nr:FadR/GntR family transcriptional regulator [Planococcus sp. PAMC 21323]